MRYKPIEIAPNKMQNSAKSSLFCAYIDFMRGVTKSRTQTTKNPIYKKLKMPNNAQTNNMQNMLKKRNIFVFLSLRNGVSKIRFYFVCFRSLKLQKCKNSKMNIAQNIAKKYNPTHITIS